MSSQHARASAVACFVAVAVAVAGCVGDGGTPVGSPGAIDQTTGTATIKRDEYGVPHVYANDVRGLYYGMGYALAEDRLFQMEMAKRTFTGSVAEVLGAGPNDRWIDFDKSVRANYNPASISAQLAALPEADRDIFEGYSAGFNARIAEVLADKANLLPKEFSEKGFEPVAWRPFDVVMVFVGSMANRFSDFNSEIPNQALLQSLVSARGEAAGRRIFDQLRWTNDPTAPTTVGDDPVTRAVGAGGTGNLTSSGEGPAAELLKHARSPDRLDAAWARLTPLSAQALSAGHLEEQGPHLAPTASNLWIAGPGKTVDGNVYFNNGPQFGNFNPAYVWGIGLHGAGFDVTGNTPFGYPAILFASNGTIAWGSTAGAGDVVDMYQLTLDPANQDRYLYNGSYRELAKRTDTIKVKGGAEATVDVYSSVHGIVTLVDRPNNTAYAKKRSWDGAEVESLLGWIGSMKAKNWGEFKAQNARVAITNNWYYADTSGNIGYILAGKYPRRPADQDFRLPARGDGTMEWAGFLPHASNPQVLNPPQGFITNWNNKPSARHDNTDGNYWSFADRVTEFIELLKAKPKFTATEVRDMNRTTSFVDVNVRYFLPFMQAAVVALPISDPVRAAVESIAAWDKLAVDPQQTGFYTSKDYTIFNKFLSNLLSAVLQDDIPSCQLRALTSISPANTSMGVRVVVNALRGADSGVPQWYDFFNGADKNAVIREVMTQSLSDLAMQFGTTDRTKWLTVTRKHVFDINNFTGVPQAGDDEVLTLNPAMNRGTQNDHIVLGDSGVEFCDAAPPGQSGFVNPDGEKAAHYQDQLELYARFDCKRQWLRPDEVDAHAASTTRLRYLAR